MLRQSRQPARHRVHLQHRHRLRLQRRLPAHHQGRRDHRLVLRQGRQRNLRRTLRRHRPHRRDLDRPQPTQVPHHRRHHPGPDPRGHRQHRTHQPRRHSLPPHRARPDRHHHRRRCRHRIHPRTRGHTQLRAQWRQVLLLPHRRHRQRPGPGRRGGQAHPHLRLHPLRHQPEHDRNLRPAVPLRGRLPRPHRPVQDGRPLYDPHLGRFTQPDPSGQETNPYLYATGDPINHTDPTGLSAWSAVSDGLGYIGDAFDVVSIGRDLVNGDYTSAARGAASFTTGVVVGAACEAAVGTSTGFLATAGCAAAAANTAGLVEAYLS
ncbi:RHS repeat-associated core domain-containing protein [Streptomyces sp. NPDC087908]|uniref:RHS repeat-associated core domain-containing protein n=1 Tax=Streptomyces sp. NPDC087908 TaxID=3365820 RepID=UPI003803340D